MKCVSMWPTLKGANIKAHTLNKFSFLKMWTTRNVRTMGSAMLKSYAKFCEKNLAWKTYSSLAMQQERCKMHYHPNTSMTNTRSLTEHKNSCTASFWPYQMKRLPLIATMVPIRKTMLREGLVSFTTLHQQSIEIRCGHMDLHI